MGRACPVVQFPASRLLYFTAFALAFAFVNPWLSIGLNAALALYFAFTGQITRKRATSSIESGPRESLG